MFGGGGHVSNETTSTAYIYFVERMTYALLNELISTLSACATAVAPLLRMSVSKSGVIMYFLSNPLYLSDMHTVIYSLTH